jgi:hypothetical protein
MTQAWEPVSGIEPLTCRLQEVRPRAPFELAAQMAQPCGFSRYLDQVPGLGEAVGGQQEAVVYELAYAGL